MAGKQQIQAPIERPAGKAYLREFSGWSTQYPPGLSDPTSLQTMENVMVNRDGSLRVRPALRPLTELTWSTESPLGPLQRIVGSFEPFYMNDGALAYLFSVLVEGEDRQAWRVWRVDGSGMGDLLTLDQADFTVEMPGGFSPDAIGFTSLTTYIRYLQVDNKILALSDKGEPLRIFHVGGIKVARAFAAITVPAWNKNDKPEVGQPQQAYIDNPDTTEPLDVWFKPTAAGKQLLPLWTWPGDNLFNAAFFYTFSNELGESAPSQMTEVKLKRRWGSWLWQLPNATMEPKDGTAADSETADDPLQVADQLLVQPPWQTVQAARAQGATAMHLYMVTWSNQDTVPVEAILMETRDFTTPGHRVPRAFHSGPSPRPSDPVFRVTPRSGQLTETKLLPSESNRQNFTEPPCASQGIVAADRVVLVGDREEGAVVRWTSNRAGHYTNFTPSKGGGYKTLTHGNMQIPSAVKLWQNPQSADTLTILTTGTDGESTGYYMAPAQVAQQSEATNIMGFEETTATPGTVSPYGCEVLNNALYHPLDTELMKSSASNYNINHKTMTDQIQRTWHSLVEKHWIISSQFDGRIYFIVNNPAGEEVPANCKGNEIWVFDAGTEGGSWSRWLIPAVSLKKAALPNGRTVMTVVRPEAIYYLEDRLAVDAGWFDGEWVERRIPWKFETNTQGANRAHDAPCQLEQIQVGLGDFHGSLRYGIRGTDIHGRKIEELKVVHADPKYMTNEWLDPRTPSRHVYDYLKLYQTQMVEWTFFASSVDLGEGEDTLEAESYVQFNSVQYRYTPISVNVGLQYGSIETFEYGRDVAGRAETSSFNGIPDPLNGPPPAPWR